MQTKSYRALKWTLFMGMAASLASACVVSTGDGDDDPISVDGGEGGTNNNTSGTKNTGGTKAGTSSGGTSAGTSSAGAAGAGTAGTAGTGEGGGGGEGYEPGLCYSDSPTPTSVPSCAPKAGDGDVNVDCKACLKASCCEEWQTCYGSEPTSACGWGSTPTADGQFDCILGCWAELNDGVMSEADVLAECDSMCLNQCSNEDFTNDETGVLVACGRRSCNDQCFPPAVD